MKIAVEIEQDFRGFLSRLFTPESSLYCHFEREKNALLFTLIALTYPGLNDKEVREVVALIEEGLDEDTILGRTRLVGNNKRMTDCYEEL